MVTKGLLDEGKVILFAHLRDAADTFGLLHH